MALLLSQFIWGFEVFDSGSNRNNRLAFTRDATTYDGDATNPAATMKAGVYTPDELAAEVQRAMRERTNTTDLTCTFNYSTMKFSVVIASPGNLSLLFAGTVAATDCNGLLGFDATNHNTDGLNNGDTWVSDAAVGTAPSTASVWSMAEPLVYTSPVIAQAIGSEALLTQRTVIAKQHVSDGMLVESIYFGTLKKVQIGFKALSGTERTSMENFLNWAAQLKRFTWQPDKTSINGLKLVLANPKEIADAFEWLTRAEVSYGTLTFYEQLS